MTLRRPPAVAVLAALVGCVGPTEDDLDPTVVVDSDVDTDTDVAGPSATWSTPDDLVTTFADPFVTLDIQAPGCGSAWLEVTTTEGDQRRVLDTGNVLWTGDRLSWFGAVDALLPEPSGCVLDRTATLEAVARCRDGTTRKVEGARTLRFETGAVDVPELAGVARLVSRRTVSRPYDDLVWAADASGLRATTLPGSAVGRALTIPGYPDVVGAHQRVRGDLYDFVAVRCTGRCPEQSIPLDDGTTLSAPSAWVLAVPLVGDGVLGHVPRIAVPDPVVDLAFHDGSLSVLSQVGDTVVVSTFEEHDEASTEPPVNTTWTRSGAVALAFHAGEDGAPLAALRTGDDPAAAPTLWSAPLDSEIPVPYPAQGGTGGGCGTTGGLGSGMVPSSSMPMSSGDQPGTATGTTTGGTSGAPPVLGAPSCEVKLELKMLARASGGGRAPAWLVDGVELPVSLPVLVDGLGFRDRLLLAFDAGDGLAQLVLVDVVQHRAIPISVPESSDEGVPGTVLVPLVGLAAAPQGASFAVATATGVHVFDAEGAWKGGLRRLPAACLGDGLPEAQLVLEGRMVLRLRDRTVAIPVPQ